MEGTETVRISHRKVNLSADDGPSGRYAVYGWFNRPVFEADSVESTEVQEKPGSDRTKTPGWKPLSTCSMNNLGSSSDP